MIQSKLQMYIKILLVCGIMLLPLFGEATNMPGGDGTSCNTGIICTGVAGEPCDDYEICGSPGDASGSRVGETTWTVCVTDTLDFCSSVTDDQIRGVLDISGLPNLGGQDQITISPEVISTYPANGLAEVTVTAETLCCGDYDYGCFGEPDSSSITVYVKLVLPPPCGGCKPDNATWTCNTYDPEPDGFSYNDSTPSIGFKNLHKFDYTLSGMSQGANHFGSEEITNKYKVQLFGGTFSQTWGWYYEPTGGGVSPTPVRYESGSTIQCSTTCVGDNRCTITDLYQFFPAVIDAQTALSYYNSIPPGERPSKFTFAATHYWENQDIYVDKQIGTPNTGVKVGGAFTSSIILVYEIHFIGSNPVNVIFKNFYSQKAGQI